MDSTVPFIIEPTATFAIFFLVSAANFSIAGSLAERTNFFSSSFTVITMASTVLFSHC